MTITPGTLIVSSHGAYVVVSTPLKAATGPYVVDVLAVDGGTMSPSVAFQPGWCTVG